MAVQSRDDLRPLGGDDLGRVAEEIANSVTHGVGLGLSLAGCAVLVALAWQTGDAWRILGCGIYGATLVGLYAASTLYHSLHEPRWKELLRIVDHSAIFLLIAGTYTPFTLVNLRGGWGWSFFAAIWAVAIAGVVYKVRCIDRHPRLSTAAYLAMGWLGLVALQPVLSLIPPAGVAWLLAGGAFYTGGVWFYARDRRPYNHAIWHLFVLGGSACHYFAVLVSVSLLA